ncbi:hypothetical protein CSOJ01_07682 [Colletotrichum sojae]|uniref:Uncharacterized protein n=1 Tax=Colletotrichum sojae TaxID=2175907 RepID=A0A8H6MTX7_9PEZI|nr:hypothetical protein CSOJ01_07682 [Colletotrichum sojae]
MGPSPISRSFNNWTSTFLVEHSLLLTPTKQSNSLFDYVTDTDWKNCLILWKSRSQIYMQLGTMHASACKLYSCLWYEMPKNSLQAFPKHYCNYSEMWHRHRDHLRREKYKLQ